MGSGRGPGDPFSRGQLHSLEESGVSKLFLYEDPAGNLSLVMIHDEANDADGGAVVFSFAGVPAGADFVVRDDPGAPGDPNEFEAVLPQSTWGWGACCTDGGAIGNLAGPFAITIDPQFTGVGGFDDRNLSGIQQWQFVTDNGTPSPDVIDLDMDSSITIICQPEEPPSGPVYEIVQDGVAYPVTPIRHPDSVEDFYSYNTPHTVSANVAAPFQLSQTSNLFLYFSETTGNLSLVMIHDAIDDTVGGSVVFEFAGVPAGASFVVRDEGSEAVLPISTWGWGPDNTDGGAIGNLNGPFEITINPDFIGGIDQWQFLSDNGTPTPDVVGLDMSKPITIICRPDGGPGPEARYEWR